MNLKEMTPRGELASTGYCLADPGREYLAFTPNGSPITLDLGAASGRLSIEWLDIRTGQRSGKEETEGGGAVTISCAFLDAAVLYVTAAD